MNKKYKNISPKIRKRGVIVNLFIKFDDEKSLRKLSRRMQKAPYIQNKNLIKEEVYIKFDNDEKIRVLIYRGKNTKPNATGLLWLHGGGHALATPETEEPIIEKFVMNTNTVVIAPDYTLSVKKPYPTALLECYTCLLWTKNNAKSLGINENQLMIGGVSAGGGLTAALSLYARDKKEVDISFQMPLYPMINHKTIYDGTVKDDFLLWNLRQNEVAWKVYLGEFYGADDIPKYASPLLEIDYLGLPPTYTFVGREDPFCNDTIEYVSRLNDFGVNAECDVYEHMYHGFEVVNPDFSLSKVAIKKLIHAYKYAIEHY
ncbi:MAG: hypothetical protein ATN36_06340 [Epulopiscium sp. Nele67-Bin005]|nr:MAG: hypothetical protein ATN36_06340 [Epulopiscium sp. Nele67-Bin005]